jgi:hypothetical protein
MYNWLVTASPGIVDRDCQEWYTGLMRVLNPVLERMSIFGQDRVGGDAALLPDLSGKAKMQ